MRNGNAIRVRHPKYGKGYVFVIGNDFFVVKFRRGLKRVEFPASAISDTTLEMTMDDREQLRRRNERILKLEKQGRERLARESAAGAN